MRGQAWLGWHCHHTPCRSSVSTGGTARALDGRRPHAESDGPPQNTAVRVREDGAPTLRALASRPGPGAGRSPGTWKRQPAGEPQSWGAGDREAPVTSHSRGPASCGAVMGYMGTKQACKTLCPGPARWARLPPPPLPRTVRTAPLPALPAAAGAQPLAPTWGALALGGAREASVTQAQVGSWSHPAAAPAASSCRELIGASPAPPPRADRKPRLQKSNPPDQLRGVLKPDLFTRAFGDEHNLAGTGSRARPRFSRDLPWPRPWWGGPGWACRPPARAHATAVALEQEPCRDNAMPREEGPDQLWQAWGQAAPCLPARRPAGAPRAVRASCLP